MPYTQKSKGSSKLDQFFMKRRRKTKKGTCSFSCLTFLNVCVCKSVFGDSFFLRGRPHFFDLLSFLPSFQEYKFSGSRRLLQLGSRCDLGQFIIRQKMRFLVSKITHIIAPGEAAIKVTPSRGPPRGHFGRGKRSNWVRQR